VHGEGGLDELATSGMANVATLEDGKVKTFEVTPEDAGLPRCDIAEIKGGDAEFNAAALTALLAGKPSAYRDTVLFTSAAALIVAGKADNLKDGAAVAAESLDTGKARAALDRMIEISHEVIVEEEDEAGNE
ncbi:MAG: anthranilate phosphoribosyltransferase, partial [Alphaproteobacteria bacterium]